MNNPNEFNPIDLGALSILPGIMIRHVLSDPDSKSKRYQLVVVIDEYTDFKAINDNRKVLTKLFKELETFQGIDLNHPIRGNQYGFYQWHMKGMGPKALVSILNYIGLGMMLWAHDQKKSREDKDVYLEDGHKDPRYPFLSNASFPEQSFYTISMAAGITSEISIKEIKQGIQSFAKNRLPWEINKGPFNQSQLEARVDNFQKKINRKVISIFPTDAEMNRLEIVVYSLYVQGYLEKINDMLDKKGGESWKRSNLRIKKKINQIVENWETSKNPQFVSLRRFAEDWVRYK